MRQESLENGSEEVAQLGEPKLVCSASRKTLFWGYLLASLPCGVGIAILITVLMGLAADWSKDILGSLVLLAVPIPFLWGGWALWRRANGKRQMRVVVHTGGLSYHDGNSVRTCRWDQIAEVQWKVANYYDDTTTRKASHTSHEFVLHRRDGVQLVFTEELQNIVGLSKSILEETSRNIGLVFHPSTIEERNSTKQPRESSIARAIRETVCPMTEEPFESPKEVRLRGLFLIAVGALFAPVSIILTYFLIVLLGWRNHMLTWLAAAFGGIPVVIAFIGWLELVTGVSFRRLEKVFRQGGFGALGLILLVIASVAALLFAISYVAGIASAHGWL